MRPPQFRRFLKSSFLVPKLPFGNVLPRNSVSYCNTSHDALPLALIRGHISVLAATRTSEDCRKLRLIGPEAVKQSFEDRRSQTGVWEREILLVPKLLFGNVLPRNSVSNCNTSHDALPLALIRGHISALAATRASDDWRKFRLIGPEAVKQSFEDRRSQTGVWERWVGLEAVKRSVKDRRSQTGVWERGTPATRHRGFTGKLSSAKRTGSTV